MTMKFFITQLNQQHLEMTQFNSII